MSERISPRFSNVNGVSAASSRRLVSHARTYSLCALMFATVYGCASQGTQIGNGNGSGGSTPANTGGDSGSGSGGNSSGSGGGTVVGTGGAGVPGSGGSGVGSGGDTGSGSGGTTSGATGGGTGTSSGGSAGPGTGGTAPTATGGTTAPGTGGTNPAGAGGAPRTGGMTGTGTGGAVAATCPLPDGICHEFFANENSARNRIVYVNQFKQVAPVWFAPVGDTGVNSPRTIEIVNQPLAPSGKALLVSINRGYAEFDMVSGAPVPGARVQNRTGVTGAARLPNGNTALGTQTAIVIVSPTGALVTQFALPNPSDELRAINRNPENGNYWFSKIDDIFEVSPTGAMLWNANLGAGTKGYAVWWRAGGGAYATTGDPSTVVEIDVGKTIVKRVGGKAKFRQLDFFSGFVRLANGNYVVANWLGHLPDSDLVRPHLVELTPQDTIAWSWGTQAEARQITNVLVVR